MNQVQEIFHSYRESPRIDNNMPPVAGAITWARGLLTRIQNPMDQLRAYTSDAPDEEVRNVERVFNIVVRRCCLLLVVLGLLVDNVVLFFNIVIRLRS